MSTENVELLREWYEHLNAVGRVETGAIDPAKIFPGIWDRVAEDAEFHERPEMPDATVYRGREEAMRFFRKTWEIFAELRWEPQEFIDCGDAVVVVARVVGVGRGSEVPVEMDETDVIWFRDGMIVRVQGFPTREEGLAAVGADTASR
jgi:ketosteroid isomerase-like protein